MIDRASIAGLGGTFASFGLGNLNESVGIVAGLLTVFYMSVKIYNLLKGGKND